MKRLVILLVCLAAFTSAFVQAQVDAPSLETVEAAEIPIVPIRDALSVAPVMALSPDGSLLATVDRESNVLQLWDTATGESLAALQALPPRALAFSPDGRWLAMSGLFTLVLDVDAWRDLGIITEDDLGAAVEAGVIRNAIVSDPEETGDVVRLAFTPDSSALVTLGILPAAMIAWDIREPTDLSDISSPPAPTDSLVIEPPEEANFDYYTFATNPDSVFAVVYAGSGETATVSVYRIDIDVAAGEADVVRAGQPVAAVGAGRPIVWHGGGYHDLLLQRDEGLEFVDASSEEGNTAGAEELLAGDFRTVALSPNGLVAAIVEEADTETVQLVSTGTGETMATLRHDAPVQFFGVAFSDDNSTVAVVLANAIQIWTLSGEAAAPPPMVEASTVIESSEAGACEIDVSDAVTSLEGAEASAAEGDIAGAVATLAEVRDSLSALITACPVPDVVKTSAPLELSERFTLTLPSGVTFSVGYPSAWTADEFSDEIIALASDQTVRDREFSGPVPPPFASGEVLVLVGLYESAYFGGMTGLAEDAELTDIAGAFVEQLATSLGETSDVVSSTIGGREAAAFVTTSDDFEFWFAFVDMGEVDGVRHIAQIALLTAPGELVQLEATALAIAESIEIE